MLNFQLTEVRNSSPESLNSRIAWFRDTFLSAHCEEKEREKKKGGIKRELKRKEKRETQVHIMLNQKGRYRPE